jgi:hypothetical protein
MPAALSSSAALTMRRRWPSADTSHPHVRNARSSSSPALETSRSDRAPAGGAPRAPAGGVDRLLTQGTRRPAAQEPCTSGRSCAINGLRHIHAWRIGEMPIAFRRPSQNLQLGRRTSRADPRNGRALSAHAGHSSGERCHVRYSGPAAWRRLPGRDDGGWSLSQRHGKTHIAAVRPFSRRDVGGSATVPTIASR